jgi:hypothetical protein
LDCLVHIHLGEQRLQKCRDQLKRLKVCLEYKGLLIHYEQINQLLGSLGLKADEVIVSQQTDFLVGLTQGLM